METETTQPMVQPDQLGENLTATEAPVTGVNEETVMEGGEDGDEPLT